MQDLRTKAIWNENKFRQIEEKNFRYVRDDITKRGYEDFDFTWIKRAVSIWHEDTLCGYFLTCYFGGFRSFHGFKFVKDGLEFQLPMARKYIEEENLELSCYRNKATGAILKALGFKDLFNYEDIKVARKMA